MTEPTTPPPGNWQPLGKKEAKAQAAAAKAYSKSQKNWIFRHKILSGMAALILLIIVISVASSSGGGSSNTASTTGGSTGGSSSTTGGSTSGGSKTGSNAPSATFPKQDGDWRLDSIKVENALDDFSGRARVTYTGDDSRGGNNIFTITVFKGGSDIATLQGSASDVTPGNTVTVQLISTDKYTAGPYTFAFQNDI